MSREHQMSFKLALFYGFTFAAIIAAVFILYSSAMHPALH